MRIEMTDEGKKAWTRVRDLLRPALILADRQRYLQRLQWLRGGSAYAALIDRLAPDQQRVRHEFFAFAGVDEGARVLDVGSGHGLGVVDPGGLCDIVGRRGEVIALDPLGYMLATLRATARSRGLKNVRTVTGQGERTELPSENVDFITSQTSLHFLDLDAFTTEAWRVLKGGGVLAAAFPVTGAVSPFFAHVLRVASASVPRVAGGGEFPLCDPDEVMGRWRAQGFAQVEVRRGSARAVFAEAGDLVGFLLRTVRFF